MQVLPHLSLIAAPDGRDAQLEILKLLAELVAFCGAIEKPDEKVQQIYNALIVSKNYFYSFRYVFINYKYKLIVCLINYLLIH